MLKRLLTDIDSLERNPTVIREDIQGAIATAKNPDCHSRTNVHSYKSSFRARSRFRYSHWSDALWK